MAKSRREFVVAEFISAEKPRPCGVNQGIPGGEKKNARPGQNVVRPFRVVHEAKASHYKMGSLQAG